jgi:hypothetical protein
VSLVESIAIVVGLIVFEVVNSVDNAIVNASVLKTMSVLWRKRFLLIGIITSVFLVRFILPLIIVWISVPTISPSDLFLAFLGQSDVAASAIEQQKPIILMFGGVFAFAAILLVIIMYLARADPLVMLAAAIGSATFFILYGIKETAEANERNMVAGTSNLSDLSKFLYLEVLDTTFSFDGVIGAFAFTINLFLILIGIGVGALVVRELTIKGIDSIAKYKYLKNGALTSIGFLGLFMIIEGFNVDLPSYVPIIITFLLIGVAFYMSRRLLKPVKPKMAM